jgi:beta-glucanase (GH16 family)
VGILPCVIVTLVLAGACTKTGTETQDPSGEGFGELVFADEFDGPGIDLTKWLVSDGHQDYWPETPWRRNYKKENVYIQDGALVIRTVREEVGFSTGAVGTGDSGRPSLFEQAFGRYEARLRFPRQQGHWCAFWLWNVSVANVDGSGRDGTEIDILERAWLIDRGQHTLNWDGYASSHRSAAQTVTGAGLDDGGWHVVRLDWYPDKYVFFIDDRETWRTTAGGVCQTPNFLLLTDEIGNFGTGPNEWGVGPIKDATLPDYFYVDYVRVYRYAPPR